MVCLPCFFASSCFYRLRRFATLALLCFFASLALLRMAVKQKHGGKTKQSVAYLGYA
jgi:hypothetical protein